MPRLDKLLHQLQLTLIAAAAQPDLQVLHHLRFTVAVDLRHGGQFHLFDRLLGQRFHLAQAALLTRRDQGDGYAGPAGASGPPDAVDIDFGVIGQVVVEYMRDVMDIQAACRNIGRNQDLQLVGAKSTEDALAGTLVQVAVDGFSRDAAHDQLVRQGSGLSPGAGEDQGALDRLHFEETCQGIGLIRFMNEIVALLGRGQRQRLALDVDRLRIAHEAIGQGADARRQGRAEQGRLSLRRGFSQDLLHILHEPHVEHFIRLVEDKRADMLDVESLALDQVEQTAGSAHHHVHTAVETRDLRSIRLSAIDSQDAHVQVFAIDSHGIGNLQRQLACGRQDQRLDVPLRGKVVQNGKRKGSGLARAGLRLADHICPAEHDRDQGGLDGRWLGIAKLVNRLRNLFAQVEGSKIGCHLFLLSSVVEMGSCPSLQRTHGMFR